MTTVRAMTPNDIAASAAIEAVASPEPWSVRLFEGEFEVDSATRHWLVAEDDGSVVGFAGMMFVSLGVDGSEGHLMNVAVAPDHRRNGTARTLCEALFSDAADRGVDAITLEVRLSNTGAIALYRQLGFAPVGQRSSYYTNPDGSKEDGLIFWLHDNVARRAGARTVEPNRSGT